ncbi:27732_t:CDS:2 [Dentiscutata erythropus]|uniref:27732_t:CDS:1 n=1 Tax=Dentiscutata erythropus TaxID=1348616 RepID=A0A9N9J779_9GLOM|nr:27732_t:CDS:2 [Dentiscutata erythropus]
MSAVTTNQALVPEGPGLKAEECIIRDKLSEREVKAISRILEKTSSDAVVALSRLSRFQREFEQRENEGVDFLNHFLLELVKERLDGYNISNIPDKQALADVMIMLCICPAEIKNLSLKKNKDRARELLTWIQEAIVSGELRDPGKLGSTYLSTFLKKDEFLSESGKPLLPSSLCKLEAVFASVAHGPKNVLKANTYASKALQHSLDNHASPSKRYIIVNMRKRGNHIIRQDYSTSSMKTNI